MGRLKQELDNPQTSESEEESQQSSGLKRKRVQRKNSRYADFLLEGDSDDDETPNPPALPDKQRLNTPILSRAQNSGAHSSRTLISTSSSVDPLTSTLTGNASKNLPGTCSCAENQGLLKELIEKVETLQEQQNYLVQVAQRTDKADDIATIPGDDSGDLPAATVEQLKAFDDSLEDETRLGNMCTAFQLVGGRDVCDTTRRILSKIIAHRLAVTMNWSGRNNKHGFAQHQNVLKLITVAVRRNPLSKNATQQEVETVIKVWLRNAGDRDGGRSRRLRNQD